MIVLVACVLLTIAIRASWMRLATLEHTVADLRLRLGAMESGLAPTVHPPVLEQRPATSAPRPEIRLKPDPARTPPDRRSATPDPRSAAPDATRAAPDPTRAIPSRAKTAAARDSIEAQIGSRWLLYIGVVAIVVGVSYFEKLAIENHWINETARVIQGSVVGLLLVFGGLRLVKKGFSLYGQMISGCGVAILYVSTYAAFNLYHLIGRPLALVLMCGVTALAAWLADRQRSQGLAILAVGGGFATPFLLASAADAQFSLFAYETVLIAGTMYLAHRRTWPTLNIVSYGFTVLTVASWVDRFYSPSKYLPTELFLTLFCAMYLYILYEARFSQRPDSRAARAVLWTGPVLYYLGSLANLGAHPLAELVFLILLSLTGVVIGLRTRADARRSADVRMLFWLAAVAPLLAWIDRYRFASWLPAGLAVVAAIYIVHLVAHLESTLDEDRPLTRSDVALLHLNGLAAFGGAYWLISAVSDVWSAPVAALFALWHGAIAAAMWTRRREQALHFTAVAGSLTVCAIGLQFEGAWVTMGWAAEAAAVIALGLQTRREWLRTAGVLLFVVALVRLLALQLAPPPFGQLVLLNQRAACGILIIALTYWIAWLHQRQAQPERRDAEVAIVLVLAKILILSFLTSEIDAYWSVPGDAFRYSMAHEALKSVVWSAVGTVLVWLGLTRKRGWIRGIGAGVLTAAVVRLVVLDLAIAGPSYVVIANARLMASAALVGLLYALALLYRQSPSVDVEIHPRAVLLFAANALTLLFLTSEITAFWHVRDAVRALRPVATDAQFAREMMLSMTWAGYATALIVAGIRRRYAPIRYLAFAVFGMTIVKVFMVDLAELDRIYRVTSIIALGVTLLATSYLYHRFRSRLEGAT